MNKKEEKWRIEGALYALRLAKEKGIDYLQEDIKKRGAKAPASAYDAVKDKWFTEVYLADAELGG